MDNVTPIRPPEVELKRIPHAQVACRADGHNWPRIRAGKKLPKNLKLEPNPDDGTCKIIEICDDCGKVRWSVKSPRDLLAKAPRHYEDPEDWIKVPRSLGILKSNFRNENYDRSLKPVIDRLLAAGIEGMRY